jgi:DNA repair ATPase RecN
MSKRDKFIARMKSQLDEVKEELHKLELKVGNTQAGVRDKYWKTIEELREKRLAAETKLEEIERSGEEAWEDLKDEAERTWKAFKAGVEVFREFSNHS